MCRVQDLRLFALLVRGKKRGKAELTGPGGVQGPEQLYFGEAMTVPGSGGAVRSVHRGPVVQTMKVLTINGSPRKDGNTAGMLSAAEEELRREGIDVERVSLADVDIKPCDACEECHETPWSCPIDDDAVGVLKKMVGADAILIGSPVYFGGVTAQLKALFDRSAIPYQGSELRDKIGGALSCGGARQGGQELTVNQIIVFFITHDMQVANTGDGSYGAMGVANDKGEIAEDEEGLSSARSLGKRTAHLLKRRSP